jgi:hypothetical protein
MSFGVIMVFIMSPEAIGVAMASPAIGVDIASSAKATPVIPATQRAAAISIFI